MRKPTDHWILNHRKSILWAYAFLTIVACLSLFKIKFSFKFEQFFPKGDPDLEYFQEFSKDFETDDNFLLIAVESGRQSVFHPDNIHAVKEIAEQCQELPYVTTVQSLPTLKTPRFTPFGPSLISALSPEPDNRRTQDSIRIMQDDQFLKNFVSEDQSAMLIMIKHKDNLSMAESDSIMTAYRQIEAKNASEMHLLGRAYFQDELASMQEREIIVSTLVSIILVSIIFFLLYRQKWLILISLTTIALGMLLFVGGLSLFGREFNGISALYPVLMLIVGTSDVVHIVSKYIDEILLGKTKSDALSITVKEIGLATFLTSLTTAAGFVSLSTSRIAPIQEFGLNSAIGVILAYVVVITFTLAAVSMIPRESITQTKFHRFWSNLMDKFYNFTLNREKGILFGSLILGGLFVLGISKITTNYNIESNLPRGAKITEDFMYFENQFSGFRPFEFAIEIAEPYNAYSPEVIRQVKQISDKLKSYEEIGAVYSVADIIGSIPLMDLDAEGALQDSTIVAMQPFLSKMNTIGGAVLVSKNEQKTRITSKINDKGADVVNELGEEIDLWIQQNTDQSLLQVKRTGTGVILDKNAEYVRVSLLQGMALALLIVVIIMALLYRDWKMLFVALLPNVIPLLFAAALLGFAGIALEATISIIFTIVFGIAVDDTIHFLSKYKIAKNKGLSKEDAILSTFRDTGKAITFTTIILFFGFLVLLFSIHPPSNIIGILISITLLTALLSDFLIIPILLRKLF